MSEPGRWATILVPIASILAGLIAGGLLILSAGENPLVVYREMARGAFGSGYNRSETLVKMIPLLLTGLGVSVAFRMRLWNIGAEGQFYFGAIFATWVALYGLPDAGGWTMVPAMMLAGILGGALWAAIPGLLRGYLGVNETITSLMLNYVAILFADWLVYGPWKNPVGYGFPGTETFPAASYLPAWGTTRVHLGLAFGLAAAVVLYVVLNRTRWGYEIGVAGSSERVARYAGMATARNIVVVMLVSGALAGLAGMAEVSGIGHSLQRGLSPGFGYTAIIVAWLGRLNPFGVVLVSFLLAALLVGGDQLQISLGLPAAIAPMLQGTILFFLLGGDILTRYRLVRITGPEESTT
ncbi:MAG: ABC transporter permease [Chloroflexia bacterium]|nr:ABC transporter permease [Chloroflexia bacterium]